MGADPEEIAARVVADWQPGWSAVGEAVIAEKIAEGIRLAMRLATVDALVAEVFYSDDDAILLRVSRGETR